MSERNGTPSKESLYPWIDRLIHIGNGKGDDDGGESQSPQFCPHEPSFGDVCWLLRIRGERPKVPVRVNRQFRE